MTGPNLRDELQASLGTAYTIEREIGGGGMSRIFAARDEALARQIVIKVLPRELAAEMSAERFTREIRLAAGLQHPHVLPVLSAGVSEGLPYYTMPFVRGESLRAAIDSKSLSTDDSLGVLRDVARALRYAHAEGVVHRDIKPENILLSSGSAVVVDFGIAKALSASRTEAPGGTLTIVGTSIGTPAYMSPEQAAADPNIDHRADIYAWGVVAYELLAGKHPFDGRKTPQQYLAAHIAESAAPMREVAPALPTNVADVVMRALEKDPDKRPQSADEILTALGGTSNTSGQSPSSVRKSRWRTPAMAAAVIAVIALGLTLLRGSDSAQAENPIMLAVLPFENEGPAEQDYFVDGLTDAVNGKLAGLSGISVIDRRSTIAYRKTTKPVKQIGSELGVQYVLGGVVRWAKADSGWRAQVMPTLVNTSDATTKWAGDPVVVSSQDPFSAQTEIASKVASALHLALAGDEKRDLAQRPTANPVAYDAYLRGKALIEANYKASASLRSIDQAISELQRAVTLDPRFGSGWAMLAQAAYERALEVPGDTASLRLATDAAKKAEQYDNGDPLIVEIRSSLAWLSGERDRAVKIIANAVRQGLAGPELLSTYAFDLFDKGDLSEARTAMERALKLNPRHAQTILGAGELAMLLRDWEEAERHARMMTVLDPKDERGWAMMANIARYRGDTAGIQRAVEEGFRYIPSPSNLLLVFMVYSGNTLGSRFVGMTPEQLHIETLRDSIATYYDNKADFFLASGNLGRAKIYHDSIIKRLERRNLAGPAESYIRLYLANAYGAIGRPQEAYAELVKARQSALRSGQTNLDGRPDLDGRVVAAILASTGRHNEAVNEMRLYIKRTPWTRRGLAMEPKLRRFSRVPQLAAFLSERD